MNHVGVIASILFTFISLNVSAQLQRSYKKFFWTIRTDHKVETLDQLHVNLPAEILFSFPQDGRFTTVVEVQANLMAKSSLASELKKDLRTQWIESDVLTHEVPYDSTSSAFELESLLAHPDQDPDLDKQWHHEAMGSFQAWAFSQGEAEIIVAVTDDGVEVNHEDLQGQFAINKNEIEGNGIDDDHNGYIDDVMGWDFVDHDNDASPTNGSHGTHVAGIIGSKFKNKLGGAGVAPGVKILPLRWYGSGTPWELGLITRTYIYAVEQGAQIITTSYRVDQFADHPLYKTVLEYIEYKGSILFNSAGNANQENSARSKNDHLLLVASTAEGNEKSGFSNYGTKVDIAAPGSDIYSTVLNNKYASKSGTSMASPNAAAVAALIWSVNPKWTREEVVAHLKSTSTFIDGDNPNYTYKLGSGQVNAFHAVFDSPHPGSFETILGLDENDIYTQGETLDVYTRDLLDEKTVLDINNWSLKSFGEDGTPGTNDDIKIDIELESERFQIGTNMIRFKVPKLAPGVYMLTASENILNPFGLKLDGDKDGKEGGDFIIAFEVQ